MPWLPGSALSTGGTLHYTLSGTADPSWGSAAGAAPPSFGSGQLPAVGFSDPSGATSLTVGRPAPITLGVAPAGTGGHGALASRAESRGDGDALFGQLHDHTARNATGAPAGCSAAPPGTQTLSVTASAAGSAALRVNLSTTGGLTLPPVVLDLQAQP